ncbi:MAG TPA: hypothetical protein V6D17_01820, partial [Candidatus Obscuribacterales bacterium]
MKGGSAFEPPIETMRVPSDFKPPKRNPAVIGLMELVLPLYLKFVDHLSFKFVSGKNRLKESLQGTPLLIV